MNYKLLSLTGLLVFATACSLPGSNDLNAPDETEKEMRNPRYLEKIYEPIRGEYTLKLTNPNNQTERCVVLDVDYKVSEEGKNSLGQPVYNVSLYAKYTDVDSFINEEVLTGRYYESNGSIIFTLPAKQTQPGTTNPDKILQITGQILNGNMSGNLRVEGYAAGNMRSQIKSDSTCPNRDTLRRNFSSKIEEIFSGDWDGATETNQNIAGFGVRLKINVQRIPVAGGFSFDIVANYNREPYGTVKPTPVFLTIALNQTPYVVNFVADAANGWPKFYGQLVDDKTIKGVLIYPAGAMETTFKRK